MSTGVQRLKAPTDVHKMMSPLQSVTTATTSIIRLQWVRIIITAHYVSYHTNSTHIINNFVN